MIRQHRVSAQRKEVTQAVTIEWLLRGALLSSGVWSPVTSPCHVT